MNNLVYHLRIYDFDIPSVKKLFDTEDSLQSYIDFYIEKYKRDYSFDLNDCCSITKIDTDVVNNYKDLFKESITMPARKLEKLNRNKELV